MGRTGPFKNYDRIPRVQSSEEVYSKGMSYTNRPLTEGFNKLLVNFDFKDNGDILVPRPALNVVSFAGYEELPAVNYTADMFLISSIECNEEDGKLYKQILIGDNITKKLYVLTVKPDALAPIAGISVPALKSVIAQVAANAVFKTPQQASIHNMPVVEVSRVAKHIGTFAYNNNYYYFNTTPGSKGLFRTKFNAGAYTYEAIAPRTLTPKEAVMWGYNMLQPNPYTFTNEVVGIVTPIQLTGVLPYDMSGNLTLSPQVNQELEFECFFIAKNAVDYNFLWEWKEPGAANWTKLKDKTETIGAALHVKCKFSVPNKQVMLRVTATNTADNTDLAVMAVGFDFSRAIQGEARNSKQVTYDLTGASCMTFWKNRLVVATKNNLFLSEVNDPSYFPYPNNMHPFQEQIIHLVPLLDQLLVFTTSQLHIITLSPDGLSWTVKCIQGNLDIKEWDLHLIQIVKNMVFFKSGNYYYMVVPKAGSTTGDLAVAPITRAIEGFFDSFEENIKELLGNMFNYLDTLELVHYYNYLDFEDVHNVYVFRTASGLFVNVSLLYNIVTRTWRGYTFESQHILQSFKPDATKKGVYMGLVPLTNKPCVQFLRFDRTTHVDNYIAPDAEALVTVFKNYQLLDTGYRELNTDYKKRFREAQLKFNNTSQEQLRMLTEFFIDGEQRRSMFKYITHHETDPEDPNFGLLTVDRVPVEPIILPGATILAADDSDINCWTLDVSLFPETYMWKTRIPFSGKGYSPRMLLISQNERSFELLNHNWVYRNLYSR